MGQGEEVKVRSHPETHIQERGEIFFFYRPKVNKEEAHGPDEVQRLYIVLRPESGDCSVEVTQSPDTGKGHVEASGSSDQNAGDDKRSDGTDENKSTKGGHGVQEVNIEKEALFRLIVMGKKSLPDPHRKSTPYWGFVELVTTKIDDVKAALGGEEYDTSTRGHRQTYPARALGEGIYRILKHKSGRKTHMHLVYRLEFPSEGKENEPQEALNIEREASFLIQIKNPDQQDRSGSTGFRGIQSKRKATFPAHLQGQFGNNRYSAADPPDFLNYEGCEFLLISASDDIEEDVGLELKTVGGEADSSCSDLVKTFGESVATNPLFKGTWG